ncbi:MAG: preprotein translocase subunit YajC [Gammaproteobacteria bacterium]|nr:preprotein translocase subunit YajC [Gammaproteobacteria bacterium]
MDIISAAYAAAPANSAATQSSMSSLVMLAVFFVVFYFLLWRPQSKRAKEQKNLLANLAKGDEVIAAGGIVGRISKINDSFVTLNVADNVELTVQKASVVSTLPKGTIKSAD